MRAFKGFKSDLTCRGFQFKESEINRTEKANCRDNGFHCAENPLDCLNYYSDWRNSVYYEVEANGDMDEDEIDSKISCTQLKLIKKLNLEQLLLEAVVYMVQHPNRKWNRNVKKERSVATEGFSIVRGKEPLAYGGLGDLLVLLKEEMYTKEVLEVGMLRVDGERYHPNTWYDVFGNYVDEIHDTAC